MLFFALTIFLSAFLLFLVQPMMAKLVLPWFGGAAAVWITCLLFYQVVLLLGYLYAHWLAARPPRSQATIHAALLALSLAMLPVIPGAAWKPNGAEEPALHILGLLAATIGLPLLLLSATSPLLQSCYARGFAAGQPYRFFAVSNAGSLLGLLSYPLLVEPWLPSRLQAVIWSAAYVVAGILVAAVLIGYHKAPVLRKEDAPAPPPDRTTRILWLGFSACGAALLYGTTNHLTQNVAAVPFLWVLPLSVYLLSFVLTFGKQALYRRGIFLQLLAVALGGMAYALQPDFVNAPLTLLVPLFLAGLFVCCMVCHGELARLKPHPARLTQFYLFVSVGGALGGAYASILAPLFYSGYFEFHVALGSCAALALFVFYRDPRAGVYGLKKELVWLGLMTMAGVLIGSLYFIVRGEVRRARVMTRNFYGALRVIESDNVPVVWLKDGGEQLLPDPRARRKLVHGTIDHGMQFLAPDRRREAAGYYGEETGVARALDFAKSHGTVKVGVVGLGTGTLAAYGRAGDLYRFYEINPLVETLARSQFTYLADSPARVEVLLGDARLTMEREPEQSYDVLAVDAFSSDAIPVHLLTREAFRIYFRHLKPGGLLVLHISNKYVELQPVVGAAAGELGKHALVYKTADNNTRGTFATTWAVIGDRETLSAPQFAGAGRAPVAVEGFTAWTDDFSNLLRLLK